MSDGGGDVPSEAEEKANHQYAAREKVSKVNKSTRPNGSSSRAAHKDFGAYSKNSLYHFRDDDGVVRMPVGERERSRSPFRRDRTRSRSPYRPGKAGASVKRKNEDDHYSAKSGADSRRFKVHYEDRPVSRGGSTSRPYADLDRPELPRTLLSYQEGTGVPQGKPTRERNRDRSRSPFRADRSADARTGTSRDRTDKAGAQSRMTTDASARDQRRGSTPSVHERESAFQSSRSKDNAKIKISLSQQSRPNDTPKSQESQEPRKPASAPDLSGDAQQPQFHEAEIIEQRRKRREAIKARHKTQPGLLVQALEHNITSAPATPAHDSSGAPTEQQSPPSSVDSPGTPRRDSPPQSPAAFAVTDDEELANRRTGETETQDDEGPSAADYDPNMDLQEDRPDYKRSGVEAPLLNIPAKAANEAEAASKSKNEFDMFADDDDDDDMFAITDSTARPLPDAKQAKTLDQSLLDNWDYPDGHYRIILGELLDNRYAVQQQIGKGTFATVVKAQDNKTGLPVAIKIAANNETMYKAGQKEMDFLKLLNESDQEDKKHVIRLLRSFDHKGHMCIVFEALSADLREVLKKFGRNIGLNLKAIRSYAQQMFLALSHMKKCQILHADLKPDNILVSERRNLLKVCDLGTAAFATDTELTPYLVSRFYRAPEVILGMPFDYAIDMWSIGCTLFELYTGRILFAGADNNHMLRAIQECRGKIPIRMLKQSHPDQRDRHFDVENNFFSQDRNKTTGKVSLRQVNFKSAGEAGKTLRERMAGNAKGLGVQEMREHASFVELVERCLQLDPGKRVTPNEALRSGFVAHGGGEGEKEGGKVGMKAGGEARRVVPAMAGMRMK
ncbi:U4/U6 small nuclear ribonucleoprotein prp4 [Friedmanniomyces endolithicus]|nr:U4/U6 small nuclear ribonucleoprotein prp4 [Friedmanniomyces endolithicus]KAK0791641.1 U4/U6 small nuclear ribonucleoprotein prp4 [Friedmanniomyces endolithicus]KAK0806370.1 U4/U6 small nuclear ribonucleoprotein prp4 [Friedmanniomyces endolithicus]KAK0842929.1 U4/U6 small nuclear ribonucleoprotein prp4 [Friedmanniomyces endolithicus]KAK0848541.1 U4/U6 small nuclear ribonucleoprotein prp4 [Friedmanniomyces endolithicus]